MQQSIFVQLGDSSVSLLIGITGKYESAAKARGDQRPWCNTAPNAAAVNCDARPVWRGPRTDRLNTQGIQLYVTRTYNTPGEASLALAYVDTARSAIS